MIVEIHRAAILMSAYGPSSFFAEQVETIFKQMSVQDILIIVDDGSRSVDWKSIKELPKNYYFWTRLDRLGASASFVTLLAEVDISAKYYLLADQDDIWMDGKLNAQCEYHEKSAVRVQATVHAWHVLSSAGGCEWNDRVLFPIEKLSPAHYCFETPAPGMTLSLTAECREMLIGNKESLLHFAQTLPHDRVIIAFISFCGSLEIVPLALVKYRQHVGNLVGAEPSRRYIAWLKRLALPIRAWRTASQGRILYLTLIGAYKKRPDENGDLDLIACKKLRSNNFDNWIILGLVRLLSRIGRSKKK